MVPLILGNPHLTILSSPLLAACTQAQANAAQQFTQGPSMGAKDFGRIQGIRIELIYSLYVITNTHIGIMEKKMETLGYRVMGLRVRSCGLGI